MRIFVLLVLFLVFCVSLLPSACALCVNSLPGFVFMPMLCASSVPCALRVLGTLCSARPRYLVLYASSVPCALRVLGTLCSVRQFTTRLCVYAYVMRVLGTLCSARPRYLVLCASSVPCALCVNSLHLCLCFWLCITNQA